MNLNTIMCARRISNAMLAERFNTTTATVSRWRNNINQPDNRILPELCDFLNCSLNDLLRPVNPTLEYARKDPAEATAMFVETVDKLLALCKAIDEPEEITEMVADLIQNGEVDDDKTRRFVQLIGEATAKSILFLHRLAPNTPEAVEALAVIEKEMSHAA